MTSGVPGASESSGSGNSSEILTERVATQSAQTAQQAQAVAGQVAQQAANQAQSILESQKDKAAGSLNVLAQALRDSAHKLEEQNQAAVGQVLERAADQADNVSSYLQSHDVTELVGDVENTARRSPGPFLLGALGLGVIAARFLKSSSQSSSSYSSSGYESRGYYNSGYRPSDWSANGGKYDTSDGSRRRDTVASGGPDAGNYAPGTMTPEMEDGPFTGQTSSRATETR